MTKQWCVVKVVAAVLRDVLALSPPEPLIKYQKCGPGECFVPVEATAACHKKPLLPQRPAPYEQSHAALRLQFVTFEQRRRRTRTFIR